MYRLSIVIPTYNERENIITLISTILKIIKKSKINGEIIVVDDNSPDETWKLVEEFGKKHKNVRLILRGKRNGLGAALKNAYDEASGDIILSIDSDFSHDPRLIPKFYSKIRNDDFDFVIGSRYIKGGAMKGKP